MRFVWCFIWLCLGGQMAYGQADSVFVRRCYWRAGEREVLPEWVVGACRDGCVVGISDPGLKPEVAREQALVRAAFWRMLAEGVEVAVVTDYFHVNRMQFEYELGYDKLITLIRIEVAVPEVEWQVVREAVTQYGEVLMEVAADTIYREREGGRFVLDLMLVNSKETGEWNELRCEWNYISPSRTSGHSFGYLLRGRENDLQVSVRVDSVPVNVPYGAYWYADSGGEGEAEGCRLHHSLWSAQVQSLLCALAGHTWQEVIVKGLSEDKTEQKDSRLHREVIRRRVSAVPEVTGIRDNRLMVDWRIKEL